MLLVKKEEKIIGYGKISNKDVLPLIDNEKNKIYIVEVFIENNKIIKIKLLENIKKDSEMGKILMNLHLICEKQNIHKIYEVVAI